MKELTKVFNNIDIPVEILDESNIWFDISGIANRYGKNITDWKNSKRTLELIEVLEKSNASNLIKISKVRGENEKTFIHNTLFVNFARFISVEFEIASNKIIMDILLGEKKLCDAKFTELETTISQKDIQLKLAHEETENAKRKIYAKPRGNGLETISRIIKNNEINITPFDLNTLLVKRGMLSVETVEVNRYISLNMDGLTPLVHEETVLKIVDDNGYKRGAGYYDTHPQLFED